MHVDKFARTAVGHMLKHYSRDAAHFGNEQIDRSRSCFNYNLAPDREKADIDYYKERLSKVKCQKRADVKTLCDWIITLPKVDFTEREEARFFQEAYQFMAKRYGEQNVVSAWVHKDEAGQAHMHFAFIPVCWDKRHEREKVSAKEVLTRNELRSIHKDMSKHVEYTFGRDIGILNGSTVGGNKTVMELKTKGLQEEVSTLEQMRDKSIADMARLIQRVPSLLPNISRAVKVALGKEQPPLEKADRTRERVR